MTRENRVVHLYRDGVWAGAGCLDADGQMAECGAVWSDDADASEAVYDEIQYAIDEAIGDGPVETEVETEVGRIGITIGE